MAGRARRVWLSGEERRELERVVAAPTSQQRFVQRARLAMLAAAGATNQSIADEVGLSVQKVSKWRRRLCEEGIGGLKDRPRPGGPRRYDHDARLRVYALACSPPPAGATHWTVRALAAEAGMGRSLVHELLRGADLKPHQVRSWLTSLDPDFDLKQADICGLYLDPPEGAIVLSIDEKTTLQVKTPVRPSIPLAPGRPERREFEYRRGGCVALLAALLVHTGQITGNVYDRHSRLEFLDFLDRLEAEIPADQRIHAIVDNLQVHKTKEVGAWLDAHPRWQLHFTPTHASWLNQIELFFSILSRRLLRRGFFHNRAHLEAALLGFIEHYNLTARPFAWTYQGKPLCR